MQRTVLFATVSNSLQIIAEQLTDYISDNFLSEQAWRHARKTGARDDQIESVFFWQKALKHCEDPRNGIELLETALELDPDNHLARLDLVSRFLDQKRYHDVYRHVRYLDAVKPEDESLRQLLSYVESVISETSGLQIAYFTLDSQESACAQVRVLQPLQYVTPHVRITYCAKNDGITCSNDLAAINIADIILVQRFYPRPETIAYIERMLASGKPVVYEADDLLLAAPSSHPLKYWADMTAEVLEMLLPRFSAITVTTETLKQEFIRHNPNCYVLPNFIDLNFWHAMPRPRKGGPLVLGFCGPPTHREDLAAIEQAIWMVAHRYGNNVAFHFMGLALDGFEKLPGFKFTEFKESYGEYSRLMPAMHIDIALVPLCNNRFNRCKSNIKWLEYSVCGVAGIYADLPVYASTVEHGVTGLLVGMDVQQWFDAICLLIDEPHLRRQIAANAQDKVRNEHSMQAKAGLWNDTYQQILAQHTLAHAARH